ncbi:MAG: hypothetical protein A2W31_06560 [Planctomycetes bacterium RBG_16_64_10]|nr:MAG: hypothetical protein A2W31_06560 [Planctomycetes bacterium RBG_16_64_10]
MAKRELITQAQAARHLGVTRARIWQFLRAGRLRVADRPAGIPLLDRRAVEAFGRIVRRPGNPKLLGKT